MNEWHEKGSTQYYCDDALKVLALVRPGLGTFYAESNNRLFGEYLTIPAAQKAVMRYFKDEREPEEAA